MNITYYVQHLQLRAHAGIALHRLHNPSILREVGALSSGSGTLPLDERQRQVVLRILARELQEGVDGGREDSLVLVAQPLLELREAGPQRGRVLRRARRTCRATSGRRRRQGCRVGRGGRQGCRQGCRCLILLSIPKVSVFGVFSNRWHRQSLMPGRAIRRDT